MIRLLSEDEFTEEVVKPIFSEVADQIPEEVLQLQVNVPHVVEEWTSMMRAGIACTWGWEEDGKIVGLLGALFITEFFTGKSMAMEQFWFVLKDYRKSKIGAKLFREFEREAIRRGVDTVWAGSNEWHYPASMDKLYRRKGFHLWGATYRRVV